MVCAPAIPQTSSLAKAEFGTIRERVIKIGASVIEHTISRTVVLSRRSAFADSWTAVC
jgi:hypothetical protein